MAEESELSLYRALGLRDDAQLEVGPVVSQGAYCRRRTIESGKEPWFTPVPKVLEQIGLVAARHGRIVEQPLNRRE